MNLEECFQAGYLRKGKIEIEKINGAIGIGKNFLEKASKVFQIGQFDVALLMAYTSMFHSARALLFKDGITERSHFCMLLYLKEKFKEQMEISNYLSIVDSYRSIRHKIQYSGEGCSEADASEAIKSADGFLKEVKKLSEG